MSNPNTDAALAAGTAVAGALLPMAGPYGVVADRLLTAGLTFWADFQARKAAGTLTMTDLEIAAAQTTTDLARLAAHIEAQGKA